MATYSSVLVAQSGVRASALHDIPPQLQNLPYQGRLSSFLVNPSPELLKKSVFDSSMLSHRRSLRLVTTNDTEVA
jgi:hypothetical protein